MMTSSCESLFQELQSRLPMMIHDLEALVGLESPSDNKAAVDRAGEFLAGRLEWAGARVQRHPQPTAGDHWQAVWPASAKADKKANGETKQILIIGHVDTVWPVGELARRPVRMENGYLYGPGAFDMKAGLVITLHAMKALRDLGCPFQRDVVFIINSDEEVGSLTSRELIEQEAQKSHCALIMEPPVGENGLTVSRKGVGRFLVRVQGKPAHAGRNPQDGVNAIEELARQILYLQSLNDPARGTTVTVGVVHGGTRPNVVPAEASAEVDLRIVDPIEGERLVATILGLTSHNPAAKVEVKGGLNRPPWEPNTACEALYHRARAIGLAMGMQLERRSSGGGSDGNYTAALGVPTLDGLGAEGFGPHALDERVRVDSLAPRAALLAGLILDLGRSNT